MCLLGSDDFRSPDVLSGGTADVMLIGRLAWLNVNRQIKFIPLAYMTVLDVTC